jgi:N-acetylmuramoyl-L-alanine amidase
VPTKVLIETANLNNATDRQRLADPDWRQTFAEAYVDALMRYYGSDMKTRFASRGGGD